MIAIWCINSLACLHWRHWEEGYILFNAASAQTHMLNEFGKAVLELLQEAPNSVIDLGKQLAVHFALEWDNRAQFYLQSVLADLDQLGLIEPYVP